MKRANHWLASGFTCKTLASRFKMFRGDATLFSDIPSAIQLLGVSQTWCQRDGRRYESRLANQSGKFLSHRLHVHQIEGAEAV